MAEQPDVHQCYAFAWSDFPHHSIRNYARGLPSAASTYQLKVKRE